MLRSVRIAARKSGKAVVSLSNSRARTVLVATRSTFDSCLIPHWTPNRTFASNKGGKKRALQEQQQRSGTSPRKEDDVLKNPKIIPPNESFATPSRPPSLIRTDFNDRNATTDFVLPKSYDLVDTDSSNTQEDKHATAYVDYKELYDPKVHLPSAPQDWSEYEPATPLWEELAAQIGVLGRPMTVAEFIQHALLHPKYGYYSQPRRFSAEDNHPTTTPSIIDDDDDLFSDDEEDNNNSTSNENPIFGPKGDFVTAPEICQVFGESIQVWMVTQWEAMGKPDQVQWVEFGPGRGTLMADMVKFALTHHQNNEVANDKLQQYGSALRVIHFIEQSPVLRKQQEESLQEQLGDLVEWKFHNSASSSDDAKEETTSSKPTIHVYWHDSFAALSAMIMRQKQKNMGHSHTNTQQESGSPDVSKMPLFVVCQEFFDALPVHAFEMTKEGWRERMVDMAIRDELLEDDDKDNHDDNNKPTSQPSKTANNPLGPKRPRLRIVLAPEATPALKALLHVDEEGRILSGDQAPNTGAVAEIGQVVEVCPEGILLVQDIASLIEQQGGAALVVDYGEEGSTDSLRGFWKHKQTHFLSLPGQTDVTADVDFTALKHAVNFARQKRLPTDADDQPEKHSKDKPTIKAYGPIPQGKFLVSMGARERVIQCIESDATSDEEAELLFYALERLVAPDQMGVRYKVLAIAQERKQEETGTSYTVPPAGF